MNQERVGIEQVLYEVCPPETDIVCHEVSAFQKPALTRQESLDLDYGDGEVVDIYDFHPSKGRSRLLIEAE